jgi:curved DNA-binding protein CbpA
MQSQLPHGRHNPPYAAWSIVPDKNPGREEESAKQTSRLNNAYEILMNPVERRDFEERFFGASRPSSNTPSGLLPRALSIRVYAIQITLSSYR